MGARPVYAKAAQELGRALAERGIGLVFGGGKVGLMGILADAALASGGEVIGVIPAALVAREIAHDKLTDLRVVHSMHERKTLMADLTDAFIALPGGFGTLEEFAEAVTWTQMGIHKKACGLFNVAGYFDPLMAFLDRAVEEGFLKPVNRVLVLTAGRADELIMHLAAFRPTHPEIWIKRDER
jgi:uncharacterized protein (TIGR00730 family)